MAASAEYDYDDTAPEDYFDPDGQSDTDGSASYSDAMNNPSSSDSDSDDSLEKLANSPPVYNSSKHKIVRREDSDKKPTKSLTDLKIFLDYDNVDVDKNDWKHFVLSFRKAHKHYGDDYPYRVWSAKALEYLNITVEQCNLAKNYNVEEKLSPPRKIPRRSTF